MNGGLEAFCRGWANKAEQLNSVLRGALVLG